MNCQLKSFSHDTLQFSFKQVIKHKAFYNLLVCKEKKSL